MNVPAAYHGEDLDSKCWRIFRIDDAPAPDLTAWNKIAPYGISRNPDGDV